MNRKEIPNDLPIAESCTALALTIWAYLESDRLPLEIGDKNKKLQKRASVLHAIKDNFQKIISNLLFSCVKKNVKVIGITSPVSRQGVTTMASIISYIIAMEQNKYAGSKNQPLKKETVVNQNQSKVLLVDTQFRNPSLHQFFNVQPVPGVNDLLAHGHEAAKTLTDSNYRKEYIRYFAHAGLQIITAGDLSQKRISLSDIGIIQSMIDHLRERYTYIILDIPPILTSAEGIPLSQICDAVALIIRAGKTHWLAMEETKRKLINADVEILGSILNRRQYYIPSWLYRRV